MLNPVAEHNVYMVQGKKLEIDYPVLMLLLQEVPVQQQDFEIVEQGKKQ